jgi:threonine dehydratase
MWVAGVDGCAAGWIAALARTDGAEPPRLEVAPHLGAILEGPERPAFVAVDIPIGLPDRIVGPGRTPERLVRPLLGDRQSSVFSIPSRRAVEAPDYGAACLIAAATSEPCRKVSKQGFMIFPKIREADALLCGRPELAGRIYESHPEVAFWSMNGERDLTEPKKRKGRPYEPGLALRRRLLVGAGLSKALVATAPPCGAAPDDLLDALAGLVVALKIAEGRGRSFPDPPERDAYDLPVAIWTFWT